MARSNVLMFSRNFLHPHTHDIELAIEVLEIAFHLPLLDFDILNCTKPPKGMSLNSILIREYSLTNSSSPRSLNGPVVLLVTMLMALATIYSRNNSVSSSQLDMASLMAFASTKNPNEKSKNVTHFTTSASNLAITPDSSWDLRSSRKNFHHFCPPLSEGPLDIAIHDLKCLLTAALPVVIVIAIIVIAVIVIAIIVIAIE
ncbi:hypothetical protein DFP72DRAFT_1081485 [Ephemerocybe angulata]|uniref:Uncharacterized protein n=1 Tax=Ephemerocybe angulata TaxID=980116 RepID=A0A8H6HAU7_9AGAR|nr:hypothetical protein DFP72DRAFT_1081485 [Tulosesus angulatus]